MKIHNLVQGSPEWHAHRAVTYNASDAPAMLGCSPYVKRTDLIKQMATGIEREIDAGTQKRFDDGHRYEELARPIAEQIIGEALYPITGSDDFGLARDLGASFDGLTMLEDVAFEHKSLNDDLRVALPNVGMNENVELPKLYRVQMEQQLTVSNAERVLFMASKWNGDTLVEERHCWYVSDAALCAEILAGWKVLGEDIANYVPAEAVVEVVPAAQAAMPALDVQVSGTLAVRDNLSIYGDALRAYIESLNQKPETDQDFADLESAAKHLGTIEDRLSTARESMLSQTGAVEVAHRIASDLQELARQQRLTIEKLVKTEKENRKQIIVAEAKAKLITHVGNLNEQLGKAYIAVPAADWAGAIKNRRSLANLKDAVNNELAAAKTLVEQTSTKIRFNLTTFEEIGAEYPTLFPDLSVLVHKDNSDFTSTLKLRILEHKQAEQAKREREAVEAEAARRAQETAAHQVEEKTVLSHEHKAETTGTTTAAQNVTPIRTGASTTARQNNDDLIEQINGYLPQMNRQTLNLVAMFCKDKLAA